MKSASVYGALAALAVAGCATPGPYAEVTGERVARADPYLSAVVVQGVDGVLDIKGSTSERLEPGLRQVMLATTRVGRRGESTAAVVPLNAKPCLRYFFVAQHESMTLVTPWKLVLKDVQPIPECVAQFPDAAPKPAAAAASAAR